MQRHRIELALVASLWSASACKYGDEAELRLDLDALDASVLDVTGARTSDAGASPLVPPSCVAEDQNTQRAPSTLECTGLYSRATDKTVSVGVRPFAPAHVLWSDGADKQRWIFLPAGSTIDSANPDAWQFPVGTRTWKEFRHAGRRIETRYFRKVSQFTWQSATYLWNETETAATIFEGGDVAVSGGTYHVPTGMECEQCHRGSPDQLLGFQAVLLGLPGSQGISVASLVAERALSVPPARTAYTIPDDGTGLAAPALGWLHVNCGISCHNQSPAATGGSSRMFLRIEPSTLEAATPAQWNTLRTTLDVPAYIADFAGRKRIVPGAPDQSLLVELAGTRGTSKQMPPIASKVVDVDGLRAVRAWIAALGQSRELDAGAPSALDAGATEAGQQLEDAQLEDAQLEDAQTEDAQLEDAQLEDAPLEDAQVADPLAVDAEAADAGMGAPNLAADAPPLTE